MQEAVAALKNNARGVDSSIKEAASGLISFNNLLRGTVVLAATEHLKEWLKTSVQHHKERSKVMTKELALRKEELSATNANIKALVEAPLLDLKRLRTFRELAKEQRFMVRSLKEEHERRTLINEAWSRFSYAQRATASVLTALWFNTLDQAHTYNRSLMQANTAIGSRFGLINKTLEVQIALGASTQTMAESAEALVQYGHDLTPAFQENLKIVTMMHNGLGIAAQTGAQLVTVFTRQLRQGAEQVGNAIAQVAQQTALSAQHAAEFAVEIGRALRLLGPGFRSEAVGVTKVITTLAGRVQELGGNAGAVVNMFRQMSGGSSQAFFLRGLAGVRSGQLGTERGAEAAMRGLAQRLSQILKAPEGTDMYAAQLEAAAEMTGMATVDIVDFREAVKGLNAPLTEAKALQKAYNNQTALLGEAFDQIRESVAALLTRAVMPLFPAISAIARSLSAFVRTLASWEPLVYILTAALPVATVYATIALARFGNELRKFAITSAFAQGMLSKSSNLSGIASAGGFLKYLRAVPLLSTAGAGWIGVAGGIGYAVGSALEKNKHISNISKNLAAWYYDTKSEKSTLRAQRRSITTEAALLGREIAKNALGGKDPWELTSKLDALEAEARQTYPDMPKNATRKYALNAAEDVMRGAVLVAQLVRATDGPDLKSKEENRLRIGLTTIEILRAQYENSKQAFSDQRDVMRDTLNVEIKKRQNEAFSKMPSPTNSDAYRAH